MKYGLLRGVVSLERDSLDCIHLNYGILRGVASLEGDNLVLFYYLTASEIWPDKTGDIW